MPLVIEVGDSKKPYDPKTHDDDRAVRRVYCTGCGTGNTYQPHQWVFTPDQVKSWQLEHKDHK